MKEWLKKLRDNYVKKTNSATRVPDSFSDENQEKVRKHFLFSGRVQHVGFRMEMYLMSERLHLTGWAKNLADGSVEAEVQGTPARIEFLLNYMNSVKRIRIEQCKEEEIPVKQEEEEFLPDYS